MLDVVTLTTSIRLPTQFISVKEETGLIYLSLSIDVGSSDDPSGCHGAAHLLEHILVRQCFPGNLDITATTGRDRTTYKLVVERENVLSALRELLSVFEPLKICHDILEEEKNVIYQEILERHSSAQWRERESALYALWKNTKYEHDVLGKKFMLENIDDGTICGIHEASYNPSKSVLIVACSDKERDCIETMFVAINTCPYLCPEVPLPKKATIIDMVYEDISIGCSLMWHDRAPSRIGHGLLRYFGGLQTNSYAFRGGWLTWVWSYPGCNIREVVIEIVDELERRHRLGKLDNVIADLVYAERERNMLTEVAVSDYISTIWANCGPLSSEKAAWKFLESCRCLAYQT